MEDKLEKCLEPICKLLGVAPERKLLADGVLRKTYRKSLFNYLTQSSAVHIEKVIREYERETFDEMMFS